MNDDNTPKPWEIESALKQEWLVFIAEMLLQIRAELARRQDPSKGDSTYGLGCSCYERTVFSITALAASGKYPWLTLIRSNNLGYAIAIGGCPIRIYRGDSESPPLRQLERARDQLPLFGSASVSRDWYWFIVVETDWRGVGQRVVVTQANDAGETRNSWTVLRADEVSAPLAASNVTALPQEVAIVPQPTVEPLTEERTSEKNDRRKG